LVLSKESGMSIDSTQPLLVVAERPQVEQSRTGQLTATQPRVDLPAVGLRHGAPKSQPNLREQLSPRLLKGLRIVMLAALAVGLIMAADAIVGTWMHRSRQGQLAADFITPRNFQAADRAIAVLQIPSLGLNETVAEGTGPATLRGGPGHVPKSAIPGASGNAVIFGHLNRFGAPFSKLASLKEGDFIYVQPKGTAEVVSYVITKVTSGGEDTILPSLTVTDDTKLSLVTTSGGVFSKKRTVVEAVADAPAGRLPKRALDPTAVTSFETLSPIINGWHLGAFAWLALAFGVHSVTRRMYPKLTRALVIAPAVALGCLFLWLAFDSWFASTV
jgi:LPXTG-site transpeptidase (sortase) family protein